VNAQLTHCPDFINTDAWPPNSPDLNPPCLGLDAGHIQPSEPYPGAEDSASDDMG